ncbi:MAG: hypothetical protein JW874_09365 [Spirochaetales bacterium]|nr:hypothetical protein [Spirochaetales bacterium]
MKLKLTPNITYEALEQKLPLMLSSYEVSTMKNPLARFDYIEIKKSATVGVWVRIFPKKDHVLLIKCMPSALARSILGFIFYLIAFPAQGKVEKASLYFYFRTRMYILPSPVFTEDGKKELLLEIKVVLRGFMPRGERKG